MTTEERHLRADAARNRKRVIAAATTLFRERGLEVGVGEIAEAAGVGKGTLFRNFASKEDLIVAVVVELMDDAVNRGEQLLDENDPVEALFAFLAMLAGRSQDRALIEALDDAWLERDEIRARHAEVVGVLEQLLARAQDSGAVRPDIGAMDLLIMFKGACEAAVSYAQFDPAIIDRQLDLVRAAITMHPGALPLRGRAPELSDLEPSR
jgi:AcrR family transcriptional regulator